MYGEIPQSGYIPCRLCRGRRFDSAEYQHFPSPYIAGDRIGCSSDGCSRCRLL
ncbi:uncharacterized protein BDW43DRAFT_186368 [Aspergillus alliaceus]|uniref:uncharacterized protein n=1 Tax=Petromyces alliaceus TaxID=209559 RepID=UPI0012A5733A|nr:uncharacterized protein BDW43DRAFT_186368 [Aspergillus alliaceus]KAB8229694.1 hypothetical protein BDW43DRAFT_186368 [Aspergillus alliaceus]